MDAERLTLGDLEVLTRTCPYVQMVILGPTTHDRETIAEHVGACMQCAAAHGKILRNARKGGNA